MGQRAYLIRTLVDRDMKIMYKRSMLGIAWTLISPTLQLMTLVFVFQYVIKVNITQYASFVFTGLLIWNWFQSSLFQATNSIVANRGLIRQPNLPVGVLPVAVIVTGWVHLLLALPLLFLFLILEGAQIHYSALIALPALMIIQFLLSLVLSYLLASLNVRFRDTQHTLGVILQLLFYVTGIFYQVDSVPEQFQVLYNLNPMVHIIGSYRNVLIYGMPPYWLAILLVLFVSLLLLPLSHRIFQSQSERFVEEL
ncbi:MAG: ABC transporter permease [Leptolyngbyaceae cyanobacterium]